MPRRILPPYNVLRSMVVDQGLSYAIIAKRYGVGYDSVFQSFKNGARKAGDEWPIKRDLSRAVRKGIEDATIDATWIRESLLEAYEKAQKSFIPSQVYVNERQAKLALTEPSRRVRYHRPGCTYVTESDIKISLEKAKNVRGFIPCGICCRKLSLRIWANRLGIEQSHLSMVMNRRLTRIRKSTALKMMRAVGEEPHATLANWRPYWRERRHGRGPAQPQTKAMTS